ncbi:MAG: hypothetical protein LUG60_15245 [Erysipelotrichaceae bacterium]|nr:hypothetical protein [Erysipelotrichaceae bacterium]
METKNYDFGLEPIRLLIKLLESSEYQKSQKEKEKPINIKKKETPIWEKKYLTISEAMKYTNIGSNNIRRILNHSTCNFVIYFGNRKLIHRQKLEEYLDDMHSL